MISKIIETIDNRYPNLAIVEDRDMDRYRIGFRYGRFMPITFCILNNRFCIYRTGLDKFKYNIPLADPNFFEKLYETIDTIFQI